jgi:acyl-CoA thioester hydrolase
MSVPTPGTVYRYRFTIPDDSIDANGHVNNVAYVKWMQDAAVQHFEALGGAAYMQQLGATWVVRSHRIEYLAPAFAGEEIEVRTWVASIRRVRSVRRYEFARPADERLLVRGETEWVFVAAQDGRPLTIPEQIIRLLPVPAGPARRDD